MNDVTAPGKFLKSWSLSFHLFVYFILSKANSKGITSYETVQRLLFIMTLAGLADITRNHNFHKLHRLEKKGKKKKN